MAKFRFIKNALVGGEISSTALGRTDLDAYKFCCETLLNMIPMLSGGAYRRPGTLFDHATTDNKPARFLPFIRSQSEAYLLYLSNITGGISGIIPTDNISAGTSATFTGSMPTLADEQRAEIQFAQSVDVMYLVHPSMKPMRITRTGTGTFTVREFDYGLTGDDLQNAWPYLSYRSDIDITPSATSGVGITLTATGDFFDNGHVGSLIKLKHASTVGCAKITAVTDATHATATVVSNFGATSASECMWESAWSNYRGWPRSITFFEERLCYGGCEHTPDRIWRSYTRNFNVMSKEDDSSVGVSGDEPFWTDLFSQQLNMIQWLSGGDTMLIGTQADEWINTRIDSSAAYTLANSTCRKTSSYGSAYIQPLRVGNTLVFVTSSGCEIRELVFSESEQSYVADSLQTLYDEYPEKPSQTSPFLSGWPGDRKYTGIVWDKSRSSIWANDPAGNLFGCVRDRRLGVIAWHRHELGGSGKVISVCTLPNPDLSVDDVWVCVQRTVNASTVYHIERIIGGNVSENSAYDRVISLTPARYFTDSSVFMVNSYPLAESDPIEQAMNHLRGESVVGTASSTKGLFALPARTVSLLSNATDYGIVLTESLPNYTGEIYCLAWGYAFESVVVPVRFDAGSDIGTSQAARQRITDVTIRFHKTIGCKVGSDATKAMRMVFRESSTPLNKSADLFTGDKHISFSGTYDRNGYVYICQDQPLPLTVCAIVAEGQTYD